MMGSNGPFLVHTVTQKVTSFGGKKVFTVGRNMGTDLDIPCKFISRNQCKIEFIDIGWALVDQSRFKTTTLNGAAIGEDFILLNEGDKISLSPGGPDFLFYSNEDFLSPIRGKKRKIEELYSVKICSDNDVADPITVTQVFDSTASCKPSLKNTDIEQLKAENEALASEVLILKENVDFTEMSLTALNEEKKLIELNLFESKNLVSSVTEKLNAALSDMRNLKSESEENKSKYEILHEKVSQLKTDLTKKDSDCTKLEEDLSDAQLELTRLLEERCCKLLNFNSLVKAPKDEGVQNSQKRDVINTVELDLLKDELDNLTSKYKQQGQLLSACLEDKDNMSNKVLEIVETELYCSICSELIYQATTLNCSHTFCKVCIDEWKKKKKECPVCRTKIRSEAFSLVVDSLVDKVSEFLGGDIKSRRDEMKEERKKIVKPKTPKASSSRRPRGNRNRDMDNIIDVIGIAREILSPSLAVTSFPDISSFIDLTGDLAYVGRRNSRAGRRNNNR